MANSGCYFHIHQSEQIPAIYHSSVVPVLTSCTPAVDEVLHFPPLSHSPGVHCACISVCLCLQKWRWSGMRQRALIVFINSLIKYLLSQMHFLLLGAIMYYRECLSGSYSYVPPLFIYSSQSLHYFWDCTWRYFTENFTRDKSVPVFPILVAYIY